VPPLQKKFSILELKIDSFELLVHFSAIFVSSSTTDGLLRNDLSGGGPYTGGAGAMAPCPPKSSPVHNQLVIRNVSTTIR